MDAPKGAKSFDRSRTKGKRTNSHDGTMLELISFARLYHPKKLAPFHNFNWKRFQSETFPIGNEFPIGQFPSWERAPFPVGNKSNQFPAGLFLIGK
jgi:hypothetical protein